MYINNIIKIQRFIRYKLYYKHYNDIFNNIKKLNNNIDPITLNNIYKKSKIKKIEKLYPIFRNNKMYIYELVSLKELIKLNLGEVYTNTSFTKTEINNTIRIIKQILKKGIQNEI